VPFLHGMQPPPAERLLHHRFFDDGIPRLRSADAHAMRPLSGAEILRPDWRVTLNTAQLPFVQHIDGRPTIREIAACMARSETSPRTSVAALEEDGRKLFQALRRLDCVAMALNPKWASDHCRWCLMPAAPVEGVQFSHAHTGDCPRSTSAVS
jgi:hypothetical protein